MHVFYTPDLEDQSEYILNEEESRHCNKVLRLSQGDEVYLVNGRGGLYQASIQSETKRNVTLLITNHTKEYQKRNHHLHIAVAPTKNIDRLEWFLEKATEICMDEITPIICERSERKIIKEDRLQKVITAAIKQSLQAYHPVLNPAVSFEQLLKQEQIKNNYKIIAHCIDDANKQYLKDLVKPYGNYIILIGPEGDFSPSEISLALEQQFMPSTLGNTRLRTETAALEACFEINYINR